MEIKDIEVRIFKRSFYINKLTRKNYDLALKLIEPAIIRLVRKYNVHGYTKEELAQELRLIVIKGIDAYQNSNKTKLSTFLQTHMKNKLFTMMQGANIKKRDASLLRNFSDSKNYSARGEVGLTFSFDDEDDSGASFLPNFICDNHVNIVSGMWPKNTEAKAVAMMNLQIVLKHQDSVTQNVVKMIAFDGATIKEISEGLNITPHSLRLKLNSLRKNEKLKSYLIERVSSE